MAGPYPVEAGGDRVGVAHVHPLVGGGAPVRRRDRPFRRAAGAGDDLGSGRQQGPDDSGADAPGAARDDRDTPRQVDVERQKATSALPLGASRCYLLKQPAPNKRLVER